MEAIAKLNNVPTSPRKMRLIADLIRGMDVDLALNTLKFDAKIGSKRMEKLVLSAISNWQEKNKDQKIEDADLFIKEIFVNNNLMFLSPDSRLILGKLLKVTQSCQPLVAGKEIV